MTNAGLINEARVLADDLEAGGSPSIARFLRQMANILEQTESHVLGLQEALRQLLDAADEIESAEANVRTSKDLLNRLVRRTRQRQILREDQ